MKYIKSYILLALMVLAVTGCKQEDLKDDVNALKDRVTLLEEQVKLLNENIAFFSKVLVRQTVDNGDGTFTEVPAYSISEVLVNDGTTFTAKFNDGNVLILAIGSKGTVTTPQLGVNPETGKWMLNGSDTPYNAVGADSSVDGGKPEFKIMLDSSAQQYYWQVTFNGTDWQDVTDAEGNRVYVTEVGGELAKDNLFKDAKVEENEFVLTYYTNGDGQDPTNEVRIPIISDLSCVINVPEKDMADGYWEIGADGASAEVEIKGDHCHWFVITPHGWEASISETLTDGKATLTVKKSATASAGLKSRATANNTDEVVVQVNKGMYWAVAKVKVREAVTSYFNQVYKQGGDITVGNVTINKATYSDGKLLSTDAATISADGVYFIPQGMEAVISSTDFNKLVLISDNPKGEPVVVDNTNLFNATGTAGEFIAQNVIFKKENNPFMQIDATGITLKNLVLDGCKVIIGSGKHFLNAFKGDDNSIGNIYLVDNKFEYYNWGTDFKASRLFNLATGTNNRNLRADIYIGNNVFYPTDKTHTINGTLLFMNTGEYNVANTISIENNTFINFVCNSQAMLRGVIKGRVVFSNLLFWNNPNDATKLSSTLINTAKTPPVEVVFGDMLKFDANKDKVLSINFWNNNGNPDGYEQGKVENVASSDPFDVSAGATFDLENGVFIPTAEYANYGAQQR